VVFSIWSPGGVHMESVGEGKVHHHRLFQLQWTWLTVSRHISKCCECVLLCAWTSSYANFHWRLMIGYQGLFSMDWRTLKSLCAGGPSFCYQRTTNLSRNATSGHPCRFSQPWFSYLSWDWLWKDTTNCPEDSFGQPCQRLDNNHAISVEVPPSDSTKWFQLTLWNLHSHH